MTDRNWKSRRTAAILLVGTAAALAVIVASCTESRIPPTLPGVHPVSWMDTSSVDFHGKLVFKRGTALCQACHGDDLAGGRTGIACSTCHAPGQSAGCARCHGGVDNQTGAPPKGLHGDTAKTSISVGAHTRHIEGSDVAAAVPCSSCHTLPPFVWDSTHLDYNVVTGQGAPDSIAEINFNGYARPTGTGSDTARWSHATHTCQSTYCHGNFSGGKTSNTPDWIGINQARCGSCHDTGGQPASLGWKHVFHIVTVGLKCRDCHGMVVDSAMHIVNPNLHVNGVIDTSRYDTTLCNQCHNGTQSCISCHGGGDNKTGAPPKGIRGELLTSDLAVGAHTLHVDGRLQADGFACTACHITPTRVDAPTHLGSDSIAEITWGDISNLSGNAYWSRTSRTCASTYCHGKFVGGDALNTPNWTGTNQAVCGSCHDVGAAPSKLAWRHELHVGTFGLKCADCHANVVDTALTITDRLLHVNGRVDTLTRDASICAKCHAPGADLCVRCHGGVDNQTGAPPKGLHGETSFTQIPVGAHTKHLTGSSNAAPRNCRDCHLTYTSVADSGHWGTDSIAEINWGGFANKNGGAVWSRFTQDCSSTYCHGNFVGGSSGNKPHWTATNQAACGSCHDVGANPSSLAWKHDLHVGSFGLKCADCHAGVVDTLLHVTSPLLHVNGQIDTLTRDPALCAKCHAPGVDLCVRCHGGTDNQTGAPPVGLHGETATTQRAVGAHTKHLAGGTIAGPRNCSDCHLSYTSVIDPGHWGSDSIAEITWGGFANKNGGAAWTRSTNRCATVYCHGKFSGGTTTNSPNWTGTSQAACGSCHDTGTTPSSLLGRHSLHAREGYTCYQCHSATVNSANAIIDLNLHVDGVYNVKFWNNTGSFNPSTKTCSNPGGCHGTEVW
jgi:predicted CxxxxCH...CXXCH cytochrome family protein